MFICDLTGNVSKAGEKCQKIVVKKRDKVYTEKRFNEETRETEIYQFHGWEIVKEINVCEKGLALWNSWSEEERTLWLNS